MNSFLLSEKSQDKFNSQFRTIFLIITNYAIYLQLTFIAGLAKN